MSRIPVEVHAVVGDNLTPSQRRFLARIRVEPQPGGCWTWTGPLDRGYGRWTVNGVCERAYQLSFRWWGRNRWTGPSANLTIDHLCRRTSCVRPDHLAEIPHGLNLKRAAAARRRIKAGCSATPPFVVTPTGSVEWLIAEDGICSDCPAGGYRCLDCWKAERRLAVAA